MRYIALLLLLGTLRTWTDSTGQHTSESELTDFKAGTVYLLRDGKVKTVPIDRLCAKDQEYVRAAYPSQQVNGEVIGLVSADTLTLLTVDKSTLKVRLEGIDSPETEEEYSDQARRALGKKLIRKSVRVEWKDKDKDGVLLGQVFLDDRWINSEQLSDGWARCSADYRGLPILSAAEARARQAKVGLWRESHARPASDGSDENAVEVVADETVYLTDTRNFYHRANCKYVDKDGIAIALSEVKGLYPPCKVCHPELIKPSIQPVKKENVAADRPRPSYNRPRRTKSVGPYIPAPYALGGGGGNGSGGGGSVHVNGYYRSNGTYVSPYDRRAPSR